MNKPFFTYFAIMAGVLNSLCLLLTFYPTHTPSLMHPSGVNWLAALAFMNSMLLIFAAVQAGHTIEAKSSYQIYNKNRISAPLGATALMAGTIFALWKTVGTVTETGAFSLLEQMGMFDQTSLAFLLLSAALLLITSACNTVLTYQNHKFWQTSRV